jgi:hypothetical protein
MIQANNSQASSSHLMPGVVDLHLGPRSSDLITMPETLESEVIGNYAYTPNELSQYVKWG